MLLMHQMNIHYKKHKKEHWQQTFINKIHWTYKTTVSDKFILKHRHYISPKYCALPFSSMKPLSDWVSEKIPIGGHSLLVCDGESDMRNFWKPKDNFNLGHFRPQKYTHCFKVNKNFKFTTAVQHLGEKLSSANNYSVYAPKSVDPKMYQTIFCKPKKVPDPSLPISGEPPWEKPSFFAYTYILLSLMSSSSEFRIFLVHLNRHHFKADIPKTLSEINEP